MTCIRKSRAQAELQHHLVIIDNGMPMTLMLMCLSTSINDMISHSPAAPTSYGSLSDCLLPHMLMRVGHHDQSSMSLTLFRSKRAE